jgi:hypothetical protein
MESVFLDMQSFTLHLKETGHVVQIPNAMCLRLINPNTGEEKWYTTSIPLSVNIFTNCSNFSMHISSDENKLYLAGKHVSDDGNSTLFDVVYHRRNNNNDELVEDKNAGDDAKYEKLELIDMDKYMSHLVTLCKFWYFCDYLQNTCSIELN